MATLKLTLIGLVTLLTPTTSALLAVPYTSETPDHVWSKPWGNACEEATIVMVNQYYRGEKTPTKATTKEFMQMLFDVQNKLYGSNDNSDSARTNYLINHYSSFSGVVKTNPTITEIKQELLAGRPVISFHYGFGLHNKNIPFIPNGSSYHTLVLVGFDDKTQQFIVNDPGDEIAGHDRRYDYQTLMNSLHDYNYADKKADGPARVIFTYR